VLRLRGLALALLVGVVVPVCGFAADEPPTKPEPGEITILALGDSITKGVRGGVTAEETFCHKLEQIVRKQYAQNARVVNSGVGGERAEQGLARLTSELRKHQPDYVLVMYGTNDSYVDVGKTAPRVTEQDFIHSLRRIVERVREAGAVAILMTEPTFAKAAPPNGAGEHGNVRLGAYMERVRQLSDELACPLVDNFAGWLKAEADGQDLMQWTTDGYHPNSAGHADIAERIGFGVWGQSMARTAFPWDEWQLPALSFRVWKEMEEFVPRGDKYPDFQVARVPGAVFFSAIRPVRQPHLTIPRLNNVVRRAWWSPMSAEHAMPTRREVADREVESPLLKSPFVPGVDRLLKFSQSPTDWTISLPTPEQVGKDLILVVLEVEGIPNLAPAEGYTVQPARDGSITLPAHHARVFGEKLQFEPLPHKNTVGYWVNPADYARWRFSGATAESYRVLVYQGCGGGQGGSTVSLSAAPVGDNAVASADGTCLEFPILETGHFQNFLWRDVGRLRVSGKGPHDLFLRCEKLAKNAVGDVRQIRLIPETGGPAPTAPLDWRDVEPDAWVPPLSAGAAAPGTRLKLTATGFDAEKTWHSLYLPTDWDAKRKYPIIVEWTGNGGYLDDRGDRCTGRPEDARLGYGLVGSHGWLVLSLPSLNDEGTGVVRTWWGDAPAHRPDATLRYARNAIREACEKFGGDESRVVLAGFSRGSLACNALGLHDDDDTAKLWRGMVCFSHYDGVQPWPYAGSDKDSAKTRLARLGDRPQWILAEQPGGTSPLLEATKSYLDGTGVAGSRTFRSTGYVNHSDAWALRPGAVRDAVRAELDKLVGR
jgi:lysophospholipase L1-like esterase